MPYQGIAQKRKVSLKFYIKNQMRLKKEYCNKTISKRNVKLGHVKQTTIFWVIFLFFHHDISKEIF